MGTDSLFCRWLCDSLDDEAGQAAYTQGRLPARPVRLSEVEALALLAVALEAQATSTFLAGPARRLAGLLFFQLYQAPGPNH